jgi:predicted ATPase
LVSRAPFVRSVRLSADAPREGYPWQLPAVRSLADPDGLVLDRPVTFLVGENGSGKSTLVEALAVALGFNAEGGSRSFRFSTRATESELGRYLVVVSAPGRPRNGFFLRAESFYNVASEVERLGDDLLPAYGGKSLHERSHGESFLDLVTYRFGPRGLYLLDEPEAALSVRGALALLTRLHDLVEQGSQFVIATHSPILLALPGAAILQLDDDGAREVGYDEAAPVDLTRRFLADPEKSLRRLLG